MDKSHHSKSLLKQCRWIFGILAVLAGARGLTPDDADLGGVDPGRGHAPAGVGVKNFSRGQTPAGVGVKEF